MNTCVARFPAGPAVAWARSNVNSGGRDSYPVELEPVKEKEKGYVDLLVSASLLLASKDFLPDVRNHGAKMLQHLLKFRREELSSFDCSSLIHQDDTDMTNMSNKFDDIIHPRIRCTNGTVPCHQVKGCLLLAEHNILCEAFDVVTSCLRTEQNKGVLHCLLKPLNKIWIQSEWRSTFLHSAFGLTCLFSDHFLEMVYKVVKFCENELRQSTIESIEMQFCDLRSLLRLMLPFLLQLLQCLHSLWRGQISGSLSDQLESAKSMMSDEDFQQNKTRKLLEEIRASGYNIIGLSLSIEGVFSDLLDISSLSVAIFEDLGSMEFRHLRELIHLVFVPLVTYCPCEFWNELRLNLLRPLLDHCEDLLYYAWFSLMHHGRAKVAYYFGKLSGSAENIEKFEDALLLEFTREVSHLLGVLSSPESNNGLLHYLLTHDCFGSLRMSLFGYWVDGEASTSAISFCLALVRLAGGTNNERFRLFVANELLPSIIRRLDDQLPCAMRNLIFKFNSSTNDTVDRDLIVLCKEIYIYISSNLCPQSQDLMGGEKGNADVENNFTCWLAKQMEDLRAKAFCAAPVEFNGEWNWEFEDEFQRYLPVYFDMLQEVDAMDDSAEGDCSDRNALLQKLNPQFRSKYDINSSEHPYLREISRMQKRKFCSMTQVRHYKKMYDLLSKLITLKPYIKGSDRSYSVIECLEENLEIQSTFDAYEVDQSVGVLLRHVLYFWEPRFHPLIREEHKDSLLQIVGQLTNAKENRHFQPLIPDPGDFAPHLKPYACFYIETKLKMSMYARAALQIHLHEDYDNYLASGQLDSYIYSHVSEDISDEDVENNAVPQKFSVLDHDLIQLSLKRRAQIVHMHHQVCTYSKCLRDLLENELLKDRLMSLMSELNAEGFFDIDSNSVNWDNECFSKLVEKFKNEVFTGHSLPRRYTIQGIIDYWAILQQKDSTWQTFEKVVTGTSNKLIAYLPQFWRDTRYYKHEYYDIVREPLKKIFV